MLLLQLIAPGRLGVRSGIAWPETPSSSSHG